MRYWKLILLSAVGLLITAIVWLRLVPSRTSPPTGITYAARATEVPLSTTTQLQQAVTASVTSTPLSNSSMLATVAAAAASSYNAGTVEHFNELRRVQGFSVLEADGLERILAAQAGTIAADEVPVVIDHGSDFSALDRPATSEVQLVSTEVGVARGSGDVSRSAAIRLVEVALDAQPVDFDGNAHPGRVSFFFMQAGDGRWIHYAYQVSFPNDAPGLVLPPL